MAACGSLQHIFEKPLPENPTLLESLSPWNQIKKNSPTIEQTSSFTEIFGELHFKESSLFQTPSSVLDLEAKPKPEISSYNHEEKKKASPVMEYHSFSSSKYSGSHKNCTEGLGFESSDEVDQDLGNWQRLEDCRKNEVIVSSGAADLRRSESARRLRSAAASSGLGFPPPISCLSKSGKPRVCFKSYRQDGRFVLKEIRVRSQEFLHACREDGRLKLHFVLPNYEDGDECGGDDDDDNDNDDEEEESEEDEINVQENGE